VELYRQKLSGPLLDRIDIRLVVPRLTKRELLGETGGEASLPIRTRVEEARARQRHRYAGLGFPCNAMLPGPVARRQARMSSGGYDVLAGAVDALGLTGRGFDRAIKVARTVADLAGAEEIAAGHMAEALTYRMNPSEGSLARAG
jgi:magnesium chelatase family protein